MGGPAQRGGVVLVTGAGGLVGSWLAAALAQRGLRVCALLHGPASPLPAALARRAGGVPEELAIELARGDVRDRALLEELIAERGVEAVFHLAARALVDGEGAERRPEGDENVAAMRSLLDACTAGGVQRLLLASTDRVYDSRSAPPHREDAPLRPRSAYAAGKLAAERLVLGAAAGGQGPRAAVVRLANVYGGGDRHASRLVPGAVAAALAGAAPVLRSDGAAQRDWLHVDDAVAAFLALHDALADGRCDGGTFNAGSGEPRSVLDVASMVCRAAGTGTSPQVRGEPDPHPERGWLDCSKLRALTGWRPRVPLEQGIERTVAWYRARGA